VKLLNELNADVEQPSLDDLRAVWAVASKGILCHEMLFWCVVAMI